MAAPSTRSNPRRRAARARLAACALACAPALGASPLAAQQPTALAADDAQVYDFFGSQVAAAETMLVIASPFAEAHSVFNAGELYVFERDPRGWAQSAKLTAPAAGLNDRMGHSLATDGGRIVAGSLASAGGVESGAVDVFARGAGGWSHEARLLPDPPQHLGRWGLAVAVDGDVIAVGAPQHNSPVENEGEVWIYRKSPAGWRLQTVLTPPDPKPFGFFGEDLALQGDRLLVGSPTAGGEDEPLGAVYVFDHADGRWSLSATLAHPEPEDYDAFGKAVALQDDLAVVGAPYTDAMGNSSGSVWTWQLVDGVWESRGRLLSPTPEADDHFGREVAVSGPWLSVTALDPPSASQAGVGNLHLYQWDGHAWRQTRSFPSPKTPLQSDYGASLGMAGNYILCGAPDDNSVEFQAGAAWLYELP